MSPRMALGVVALLLAASAPVFASGDVVDPVRPVAAVAVGLGSSALVSWVPGPEAPDFFKIYGVRNDTLAFLSVADPNATTATVEGGFPQYAVTAVRDGVESEAALAVLGVGLVCVRVEPGIPPGIAVGSSCAVKTGTRVAFMANARYEPVSGASLAPSGLPCMVADYFCTLPLLA